MIPTENLTFTQFVHVAFGSSLSAEEMKQEIVNFVMNLETQYTDKIAAL